MKKILIIILLISLVGCGPNIGTIEKEITPDYVVYRLVSPKRYVHSPRNVSEITNFLAMTEEEYPGLEKVYDKDSSSIRVIIYLEKD